MKDNLTASDILKYKQEFFLKQDWGEVTSNPNELFKQRHGSTDRSEKPPLGKPPKWTEE